MSYPVKMFECFFTLMLIIVKMHHPIYLEQNHVCMSVCFTYPPWFFLWQCGKQTFCLVTVNQSWPTDRTRVGTSKHPYAYSFSWNDSLVPGRFLFNFMKVIFKLTLENGGWCVSYEIALRWMPQYLTDDNNIGSGNGLVPLGSKPLPEPMLTQIYVAKWRH